MFDVQCTGFDAAQTPKVRVWMVATRETTDASTEVFETVLVVDFIRERVG